MIAGITVGIIALPLAMAFAIASGVSPDRGLYTAIIAGFLISALGGSRVQIGGPTGAFVVIVYGIIQTTGYNGLCLSMLIASFILILLGVLRIGTWIQYIPYSLITGFTTGIALLIFSTQIKDFFGLSIPSPPADFLSKWKAYITYFSTLHLPTLGISAGTLGFILCIRKWAPKLPWGILAIILATLLQKIFSLPVETIASRFGTLPQSLPMPAWPDFSIGQEQFPTIVLNGLTIAFLAGVESLLSAVIGDGMIGGKHRSNCELIAQGIANLGSALGGGIPATGAIARTAANVKNGGQTPVSGMIHALTLWGILLFLSPLASQIPLASLAAILLVVSWNMSELPHFIGLIRSFSEDRLILLTSFFLTVFVDITVAIFAGMLLACVLFMKKMSETAKVIRTETEGDFPERQDKENISHKNIPKGIEVYEIQGPFFFGAANILQNILEEITEKPQACILRLRNVPLLDASGIRSIKEFHAKCQKQKVLLFLAEAEGKTQSALYRFHIHTLLGEHHICSTFDAALSAAKKALL